MGGHWTLQIIFSRLLWPEFCQTVCCLYLLGKSYFLHVMTFLVIQVGHIPNLTQTQSHNHYYNSYHHWIPHCNYFDHYLPEKESSFTVSPWMFPSLCSDLLPIFVASIQCKSQLIMPMTTAIIPQRSIFFCHRWFALGRSSKFDQILTLKFHRINDQQ